jgi:hypothetical protein
VVAHDRTGRRRRAIGGSGSLLINPQITGDLHLATESEGGHLFAVGHIDPNQGYVHVLDDVSLSRVMHILDTVSDFVNYLTRKERFIASGQLHGAYGEEDLLAYYLKNINEEGEHDFPKIKERTKVLLEEGHWENLLRRPEMKAKLNADRESYLWDAMIEEISRNTIAGTLEFTNHPGLANQERMLRFLAREPRVRRRMLGRALLEKIMDKPPPGLFSFRIHEPSGLGDPYYVFVIGSPLDGVVPNGPEWLVYRENRRSVLLAYCMVVMRHYAAAERVIGIATEAGIEHGRSHDVLQIERVNWNAGLEEEARIIQEKMGWLTNVQATRGVEDEYPVTPPSMRARHQMKCSRNAPCPCGSGRKFKHCHGRAN